LPERWHCFSCSVVGAIASFCEFFRVMTDIVCCFGNSVNPREGFSKN